jgi:hypothetical protein
LNVQTTTTPVNRTLFHDLQLRGQALPFQTPTIKAQTTLRGIMILETTIKRLEGEIAFIETNASTAVYLTENACPCTLCLEMRIMLKLTATIIRDGLKRACYNSKHELQSAKTFVACVESVLKTKILGKVGRPHSYKIPFNLKDRVISDLNMLNGPCRKILDSFEELVEVCITEKGEKDNGSSVVEEVDLWKSAIVHYRMALQIMLSKVNGSEQEVVTMQNHFDMFSQIVIFRLGYDKEIITNMHLIHTTSHMAKYIFHWKCLYRHSQQGWEHLMGNFVAAIGVVAEEAVIGSKPSFTIVVDYLHILLEKHWKK